MSKFLLSFAAAFNHKTNEKSLIRCPPDGVQLPGVREQALRDNTIFSCSASMGDHQSFNLFIDYGFTDSRFNGWNSFLCDEMLYAMGYDIDTQAQICPVGRDDCPHHCENTAVLPVMATDSVAAPVKSWFHKNKDHGYWVTSSDLDQLSKGICGVTGLQNLTANVTDLIIESSTQIWIGYTKMPMVKGDTTGAQLLRQLLGQLGAPDYINSPQECGAIPTGTWYWTRQDDKKHYNNYYYSEKALSERDLSETFWKTHKRDDYRLVCPDHMKGGVKFPGAIYADKAGTNAEYLCMAWTAGKNFAYVSSESYQACEERMSKNGFQSHDIIYCLVEGDGDNCYDDHCPDVVLPKLVHECVYDKLHGCGEQTIGKQIDLLPGICVINSAPGIGDGTVPLIDVPSAITYQGGFQETLNSTLNVMFEPARVDSKDTCAMLADNLRTEILNINENATNILSTVWYYNTDCPEYEKYGACWGKQHYYKYDHLVV